MITIYTIGSFNVVQNIQETFKTFDQALSDVIREHNSQSEDVLITHSDFAYVKLDDEAVKVICDKNTWHGREFVGDLIFTFNQQGELV
jgi:hypothetical protein